MITLAFYKGRASRLWHRMQDSAIRRATGSPYSHVELIVGPCGPGQTAICLSSSGRDGGVREKPILIQPDHWDLAHLAIEPTGPARFIRDRIGAGYDYRGILLSQALPFGCHDSTRWFCSEICAAAIGLEEPHRLSPGKLWSALGRFGSAPSMIPDCQQ